MDFLAAAKMKATTTVTLYVTFLIAVGCSSAEVNAPNDIFELVVANKKLFVLTSDKQLDFRGKVKKVKGEVKEVKVGELELLGASGTLYVDQLNNPEHPTKPGQHISIIGLIDKSNAKPIKPKPIKPIKPKPKPNQHQLVITGRHYLDSGTTSLIFKNIADIADKGQFLIQGRIKLVKTIGGGVRVVDIIKVATMELVDSKEEYEDEAESLDLWKWVEVEGKWIEVEELEKSETEKSETEKMEKEMEKASIKASTGVPARSSWISAGIFSLTVLLAGAVALISWTLQKKTKAHCKESSFSKKMK